MKYATIAGQTAMKTFIFILLFVLASNGYGQVPKGWRIPTQADIKGQWSKDYWDKECEKAKGLNKKSADDAVEYSGNPIIDKAKDASEHEEVECWKPETFPVHVATGDYNGDGVLDEARILISTVKRGKIGFFAFLKAKTGPAKMIRLDTHADSSCPKCPPDVPQDYYIGTQSPIEKLETWCGRGGSDCEPGEPASVTLKRDGIMFGMFEASATLAYWSVRDNKFKLVAISD
jgi:hypothetical protein